jgi:hypothetical protein
MSVANVLIPLVLVALLAALLVAVPGLGPWRARRRCRATALALTGDYGFSPTDRTTQLSELSSLPPLHYGTRRQVREPVAGSFSGLPAEVFGYTCRENGTRHWYGVAVVRLGRQLPPLEVRHEPVFTSARVRYSPADARRRTGAEDFDASHRASTPDDRLADTLLTPGLARTMLAAPETFDWRVEGGLLVLWRRDGWTDATTLVDCCLTTVHALAPVLDLDPDLFDAPRAVQSPEPQRPEPQRPDSQRPDQPGGMS